MKRKFLVVLMAIAATLCMAFGLSACGEKNPDATGNNPPVVNPSGGEQGNQGNQGGGTQKPDDGEQGGTQKPDEGEQGNTPAPHVHSFGEWKVVTQATHTQEGVERQYCECGEYNEKSIPKVEHSFGEWKVETPATHTQEGVERQYCECGEYNEKSIPKTEEHTFGEWKVTKESTCNEAGTKERECACGEKETETLPFAGHDFEDMTCKVCGTQASLGLAYTLINEDKEYAVSGIGECKDTDIIITNNYQGKPVTAIREKAFFQCVKLTSVIIPDSVTSIGYEAFGNCSGLTSIDIPDSVTSIGYEAFGNCSGLTGELKIPDSVTEIGDYVFNRIRDTAKNQKILLKQSLSRA